LNNKLAFSESIDFSAGSKIKTYLQAIRVERSARILERTTSMAEVVGADYMWETVSECAGGDGVVVTG
jgi:hypothetical protein